MTRKALALLALALAAVLVAGCGGGDSGGSASSEGQEYVDAVVEGFGDDADDSTVPEEDKRCAGERVVDILGVDRLESAGVTPEELRDADNLTAVVPDLTSEEADQMVDAIYDCIDVKELFVAGFASSVAEDGITLPDDKIDCLAANFENSDRLREAFAASILTGEDPDFDSDTSLITEILGDCLTIDELLKLGQQASGE